MRMVTSFLRCEQALFTGLVLGQLIREGPESAVELDVLVDALHLAGAGATARSAAATQTALDEVLLHHVERGPEVVLAILEATSLQQLASRAERGVEVVVFVDVPAEVSCCSGEGLLFNR